jgi:hypothetical protein
VTAWVLLSYEREVRDTGGVQSLSA